MEAEGNEIAAIVAGLQEVRGSLTCYRRMDWRTNFIALNGRADKAIATLDTLIQRVQGMDPGRVPEQPDAFTERCEQATAEHYADLPSDLNHFSIQKEGRELLRILPDGTIVRGDAFTTTDEASLVFWQAVEAASQPATAPAELVETVAKAIRVAFCTREGSGIDDYTIEQFKPEPQAALSIAIPAIEAKQREEVERLRRNLRFALGATKLHLEMERYTSNHAARRECIRLLKEALDTLSQPPGAESED